MQTIIGRTRESDLDEVLELLKLAKLTVEGVSKHLDHFYVVKDNGKLVGCAGLEVYERVGLLRSLAVHPNYQKSGLGTELTEAILSYAKDLGIEELYLLTSTARRFFEKFGFRVIPKNSLKPIIKSSPNFSNSCEDAMVKELNPAFIEINGYRITDIKFS